MMRKFIVVVVMLCVMTSIASAQEQVVLKKGKAEVELGLGLIYTDKYRVRYDEDGYEEEVPTPSGISIFTETRFNLTERWDIGARLSYSGFSRYDDELYYRNLGLSFVGDHNWRSEGYNYFVGAGFGIVRKATDNSGHIHIDMIPSYLIRCGLEVEDALRVTVDCHIDNEGEAYLGISLGFVFGGKND